MKHLCIAALALSLVVACQKKEEVPAPAPATAEATQETAPPASPKDASPFPTVALAADAPIPGAGVALWLIGDDAAAGALETWQNAKVAGVTAKAASADVQPVVVANAINGHAAVRFDGADDMLMTSIDIGPVRMPDATVIAVFRSGTAEKSPYRKLYGNDNGGYDRAAGLDDRAEPNYTVFTGDTGVTGYFPLEANTVYVTADQFSADAFSGWVNGKATVTSAPAHWGEDALPNLYLGNTGTAYGEFWNGDLAEIIVYARKLTDEERVRVEDYLAAKYKLTLTR